MDRKVKNGYSLIELLVVIVIMGIILSIGIPKYLSWKKKYEIESKTRKIESFVKQAKMKAFTQKKELIIEKNGSNICLKDGSSYISCIEGTSDFEINNAISISDRGTTSKATIYYKEENYAKYDCIKISNISVKADKCNGNP